MYEAHEAYEEALTRIIAGDAGFMAMLRLVRQAGPPGWHVGAGAVRSLVWDSLHGRSHWQVPKDIDVVYFDAGDLSAEAERAHAARLLALEPSLPWEVANQARVHLWYGQHFGFEVAPLGSLYDAVSTWPEFATCVAVHLGWDEQLEILAPFGLEDLFSCTIRRNPARVSVEEYRRRVEAKRYAERWAGVRIVWE